MTGPAFLCVFAAGWAACLLWVHRVAVLAWLDEAIEALTTDPPPAPARTVHLRSVRMVPSDEGPEAA